MNDLYLQCQRVLNGSRKLKRWVEDECTLHHCPRSSECAIAVKHFSKFKGFSHGEPTTYGL